MRFHTRTFAAAALLFAAAGSIACGDDDDDEEQAQADSASSCYRFCAAQYQDCPDSVDFCHQLCDAVIASLDAECQAKSRAYWDCGSQIEWMCQSIIATPVDDMACRAEEEPAFTCLM